MYGLALLKWKMLIEATTKIMFEIWEEDLFTESAVVDRVLSFGSQDVRMTP